MISKDTKLIISTKTPLITSFCTSNGTSLTVQSTDKRTDACSRHFMIWKINSGLWAVGWAGLWNKRFGPIMSNFWGRFFQLFVGKKKKKIWKHCSDRTEKLHRKKVFFFHVFVFFYRQKIWVYNIGNKHLSPHLWVDLELKGLE